MLYTLPLCSHWRRCNPQTSAHYIDKPCDWYSFLINSSILTFVRKWRQINKEKKTLIKIQFHRLAVKKVDTNRFSGPCMEVQSTCFLGQPLLNLKTWALYFQAQTWKTFRPLGQNLKWDQSPFLDLEPLSSEPFLNNKTSIQWTPSSQIYLNSKKIIFGQKWFLNKKIKKCKNHA